MDKTYTDGLNDAWKLLKAFCDTGVRKRQEVFGEYVVNKLVENMSPQEALAKLEAYEETKVFKIGDVVEATYSGRLGVITMPMEKGHYVLFMDGSAGQLAHDDIKKTGKHIDITSVLEQLRGE